MQWRIFYAVLILIWVYFHRNIIGLSYEEGKDQELISNQVPHLTRDIIWESDKKNTRKYHTQGSQEVSPFPADDHKAARNRQDSLTKTNTKHK